MIMKKAVLLKHPTKVNGSKDTVQNAKHLLEIQKLLTTPKIQQLRPILPKYAGCFSKMYPINT